MNPHDPEGRPSPGLPLSAVVAGMAAAVATGVVVSHLTPDGNLVVSSVPALAVGSAVFGIALVLLRWRRRG